MHKTLRTILTIAAAAVIFATTSGAFAYTLSDVLVSGTYGTGANTSVVVIDFGTKSYAFAYSYNGAKSGQDALVDLNAANIGAAVTYNVDPTYGLFVSDIAYNNQPKRITTGLWPGWNYYTSADGATWTSSWTGATDRALYNGSWDAWNYTGFDPDTYLATAADPVTPTVPEPASLTALCSMIGLAGSVKLLRLRRR